MIKDKAVVASLLGAVTPLAGEAVTKILVGLGLGSHAIFEIDSIIITENRPSFIYGLIVNMVAGGIVAVIAYYALTKISRECIIYKATAISLVFWLGLELFATAFFEGKYIDFRPLWDYGVHLIGALTNGIALGLLFKLVLFKKGEKQAEG